MKLKLQLRYDTYGYFDSELDTQATPQLHYFMEYNNGKKRVPFQNFKELWYDLDDLLDCTDDNLLPELGCILQEKLEEV